METISKKYRFQNIVIDHLPIEICMYIFQFLEYSELYPIYRFSNIYYDITGTISIVEKDKYYFHSKILIKKYQLYRLISKYFYYIDYNSCCNFCTGRYAFYKHSIRCNNCGHVNVLNKESFCWNRVLKLRNKTIEKIKNENSCYKISLINKYR